MAPTITPSRKDLLDFPNLPTLLARIAKLHVVVIGDVMIDRRIEGTVDRVSPEAACLVLKQERVAETLGGAGNVAANVAALGAQVTMPFIAGDDHCDIVSIAHSLGVTDCPDTYCGGYRTPIKTRLVGRGQQLLRVDDEAGVIGEPTSGAADEWRWDVLNALGDEFSDGIPDALIIADYDKGGLPDKALDEIVEHAEKLGIPIYVDAKPGRVGAYSGRLPTLWKSNEEEMERVAELGVSAIAYVTTCGDRGMSWWSYDCTRGELPALSTRPVDVTGAGDTVLAALACAHAAGATIDDACKLASIAAGIAVETPGTAAVTAEQIRQRVEAGR